MISTIAVRRQRKKRQNNDNKSVIEVAGKPGLDEKLKIKNNENSFCALKVEGAGKKGGWATASCD